MEDILKELSDASVNELRARLKYYGDEEVGPVTNTTKPLFIKKLAEKIFAERFPDRLSVKADPHDGAAYPPSSEQIKSNTDSVRKTSNDGALTSTVQSFFGICLPPDLVDDRSLKGVEMVFTDKVAALKAVKTYKGSRFKAFKTLEEAEQFSKTSLDQICSPMKPSGLEPVPSAEAIAFKAPKMPELFSLRRMIEKGEEEKFKETVWSNPRYLISSGDTPVILQEGFRYNSLHVAAKSNQPQMCHVIIETIQDPAFVKTLYPMDSDVTCNNRIKFLTDLYLNMPDKGFCESPLHFACKFGFVDVVEVFASHPNTDRKLINKHGETPSQIVCSRCSSENKTTAKRIRSLLEDSCYVPLLRSEDNCSQPLIGDPWSPDLPQQNPLVPSTVSAQSPRESQLVVRAYAGPMSPSLADTFHRQWMTPSPDSPSHVKRRLSEIRREDCDKGIERIGRKLARDLSVPWAEYWQFLKAYVDMKSDRGLNLLNNHLRTQYLELFPEQSLIDDGRLLDKNLKNCGFDVDSPNILDYTNDSVFPGYDLSTEMDGQLRLDLRHKYDEDRRRRSSSSSSGSSESNYSSCRSGSESESDEDLYHIASDTVMRTEPDKEIAVVTDVPTTQEAVSQPGDFISPMPLPGSSRGDCNATESIPPPALPDSFTKYRDARSSNTDIETSPILSLGRVSTSETSSDIRLPYSRYAPTINSEKLPLSPSSVETLVSSLAEDIESKLTLNKALNQTDSMEGSFARIAARHGRGGESPAFKGELKKKSSWDYVESCPVENEPEKMITDADEVAILRQSKFTYLPGVGPVSKPSAQPLGGQVLSSSMSASGGRSGSSTLSHGSQQGSSAMSSQGEQGSATISHQGQPGSSTMSHQGSSVMSSPVQQGSSAMSHQDPSVMSCQGQQGSSAMSQQGSSAMSQQGSSAMPHQGSSATPHQGSSAMPHQGSSAMSQQSPSAMSHPGSSAMSHQGSSVMPHQGSSAMSHQGSSAMSHQGQEGYLEPQGIQQCSSTASHQHSSGTAELSQPDSLQAYSISYDSQRQSSSTSNGSQYLDSSTTCGSEFPTSSASSLSVELPGTPRTPQQNHHYYPSRTPQQRLPPLVFIHGTGASKLDVDVLRAIEDIPIDPQQYPYIHRWKKLVTSFDEDTRQNWPTPARLKSQISLRKSSQMESSPTLKNYPDSPLASPVSSLSSGHTHQRLPPPRFNLT